MSEVSINSLDDYKNSLDSHAIVAETDSKGRIIYANSHFCKLSGYGYEELVGQDHRILNSGFHEKVFFRTLWKTIASGETWHGEVCNRKKSGELYWVKTTIVPFHDAKGRIKKFVSIRTDITDLKNAEEKLRKLNEDLQMTSEKLAIERETLDRKNIALRELLTSIESQQDRTFEQLKTRLDEVVYPICNQLRQHLREEKVGYIDLLYQSLEEIDATLIKSDRQLFSKLSPKEIQICECLRKSMSAKEIAGFFHISPRTVAKHCENIRKKLDLKDRSVNLTTFLRARKF